MILRRMVKKLLLTDLDSPIRKTLTINGLILRYYNPLPKMITKKL